jgi:hypothetical protein
MSGLFRFWSEAEQYVSSAELPAERIALRNQFIREQFDADVKRAGWARLLAGDTLPSDIDALVVGVALWNRHDVDLLARMAEATRSTLPTFIFDIDDVKSPLDLEHFMPGVPLPSGTPVFAEYRGGNLVRSAQGAVAGAELLSG